MGLTTRLQSMVPPAAKMVVSKQPSIRKLLRRVLPWEPGGPLNAAPSTTKAEYLVLTVVHESHIYMYPLRNGGIKKLRP